MKYDFTTILDRSNVHAVAIDKIPMEGAEVKEGFSKIPMWIADMNFATVPSIQEEIIKRVNHPTYGYYITPPEYYDAIINWHKVRNGIEDMKPEYIGYENGVLGCVASAIQAFTVPGETIFLHSPAYIGFQGTVRKNGRNMVFSELVKDEQGIWRMDYEDMDKKIKENQIHFAIFCNPHNPTGRSWDKEEIEQAMQVFKKNQCVVVSDEIWSDILSPETKHIPTYSVSEDAKERTISVYAPSKTFNLAGLIGSYHVIHNPYLRDRVVKQSELSRYNMMNVLSMHALMGAYSQDGMDWVDELNTVIRGNIDYTCDFINQNLEDVSVTKPDATYMLLLDCTEWCKKNGKSVEELRRKGIEVGVIWQSGEEFVCPNSIRMNLALPHSLVVEAMDRLKKYVF